MLILCYIPNTDLLSLLPGTPAPLEAFVDISRDAQTELHNKIPQDVLNSAETNTIVKHYD